MNAVAQAIAANKTLAAYCAIGALGAGSDFAIYSALIYATPVGYQASNAAGYLAGTLLSFTLNAKFNFKVTDRLGARLAMFLGVALVGYGSSAALLFSLVDWLGFNAYLAKAVVLVAVVLIQFNLNRRISFREPA